MKKKKLLVLGLVAAMSASSMLGFGTKAVAADTMDEITASIDAIQTQKTDMLSQIDDLEARMVTTIAAENDIVADQAQLETDMAQTERDLTSAQEDKQVQHEAMKRRIQYVYERGGDAGWVKVFLENGDINAWLNSNEYADNLYRYDRDQLQAYADAVTKVQELQQQQQQQKAQLEAKKNSLNETHTELDTLIAQAREQYDDFDDRLAAAYAMADEYQALVEAQNESISEMVAAQQAAAAEAEEFSDKAVTAVDTSSVQAQASIDQAAQQLAASTGTDYETARQAATQAYQMTGSNGTASGSALLAYAQQFLGNPYVYGGNSLTNGIDCSGFVQQVYANFGISTARTDSDIRAGGTEVSYADVQVGDVVCYSGHVGIYAGDGKIINAADESQGIVYTNADYDQILSVRRYLND